MICVHSCHPFFWVQMIFFSEICLLNLSIKHSEAFTSHKVGCFSLEKGH